MATGRLPDPNTAPLTAKGDLYTYSTVPARLAVGSNGDTLVADSSTTTGLRWQGQFMAGKNKIINGDFGIWQRGTSFTANTFGTFYADRWYGGTNGNPTRTVSRQTFTPGTAPVAGYEGVYFLRIDQSVAGTGASFNVLDQRIEDVQTFAGQTVTVSFWAKAAANTTIGAVLTQVFGSGGSSDVNTTVNSSISVTTSWQRFSYTVSVPSIASKTIGTGSCLALRFNLPLNATFTLDFWGVQVEAGSVATPFTTATGTLAGELAAAMRYYYRTDNSVNYNHVGWGLASSATNLQGQIQFPVRMRVAPTSVDFASLAVNCPGAFVNAITALTLTTGSTSRDFAEINITSTGMTARDAYSIITNNTTNGYLAFNAEL